MIVNVPCAVGELIDKITILEIKQARINDTAKLINIGRELAYLLEIQQALAWNEQLEHLRNELRHVNERMWDVEDRLRSMDKLGDFGAEFVEMARSVYVCNDNRSRLKKAINELTGSAIVEEKSYV